MALELGTGGARRAASTCYRHEQQRVNARAGPV